MDEVKTSEIMINGETDNIEKRKYSCALSIFQLAVVTAAIIFLLICKSFFTELYDEVSEEYRSRMYDSIFAEDDGEGLVELE